MGVERSERGADDDYENYREVSTRSSGAECFTVARFVKGLKLWCSDGVRFVRIATKKRMKSEIGRDRWWDWAPCEKEPEERVPDAADRWLAKPRRKKNRPVVDVATPLPPGDRGVVLTRARLRDHSISGGYRREQLDALGIVGRPTKGWLKTYVGVRIATKAWNQFVASGRQREGK